MQESKQERPVPASITTDQPSAEPTSSPEKMQDELSEQRLNSPKDTQASPSRLMRSAPALKQSRELEDQLIEEEITPAASEAPLMMYEMDSVADDAKVGRAQKNDVPEKARPEKTRPEKKAIISQGLMKKERAKSVRSPEEWLAHINELITAGDNEKAKLELATFKKYYPDYFIDPDLNKLLE